MAPINNPCIYYHHYCSSSYAVYLDLSPPPMGGQEPCCCRPPLHSCVQLFASPTCPIEQKTAPIGQTAPIKPQAPTPSSQSPIRPTALIELMALIKLMAPNEPTALIKLQHPSSQELSLSRRLPLNQMIPTKGKSLYLGLTHSKSHLLPARSSREILQILGEPTNIFEVIGNSHKILVSSHHYKKVSLILNLVYCCNSYAKFT